MEQHGGLHNPLKAYLPIKQSQHWSKGGKDPNQRNESQPL